MADTDTKIKEMFPGSLQHSPATRLRSYSLDGHNDGKFHNGVHEYTDWNASSMGVDKNGNFAILAARRGFLVVNFDEPSKPKKVIYNSKWEPGALEWSPHTSNEDVFAMIMNQKIEVWNVHELSRGNAKHILTGHTRSISDVNWNYFDPFSLLSCSMDTYINLWDLRSSRKPVTTFTTVAGSSQVKWNRKTGNLFASAHDGDVRIWDIRKGNIPSIYIAGHLSKIHGLDWSPQKEAHFVTASNDSTVKFWNMNSPRQPRASINNGAPVWKARYTPFGSGLVTVLVPQLRRNENSLFLWNTSEFKNPIHKFDGHSDVILEFQWRSSRVGDVDEYQLVSWSKDQSLRLWKTDRKTIQAITGEFDKLHNSRIPNDNVSSPGSPTALLSDKLSVTSNKKPIMPMVDTGIISPPTMSSTLTDNDKSDYLEKNIHKRPDTLYVKETKLNGQFVTNGSYEVANLTTFEDCSDAVSKHQSSFIPLQSVSHKQSEHGNLLTGSIKTLTLGGETRQNEILKEEFALINHINLFYKIDKLDAGKRVCIVSTKILSNPVKLYVTFPLLYPNKAGPEFTFSQNITSPADKEATRRILIALQDVSQQHVKFNRPCLEPCLHQLANYIEALKGQEAQRSDDSLTPMTPPSNHIQSFTFKRADAGSDSSYKDSTVPFPRTCGARFCGVGDKLIVFDRPQKFSDIANAEKTLRSLSALYAYLQNLSSEGQFDDNDTGGFKTPKTVGKVYVSDTSSLLPVNRYLAENYVLSGDDPSELCLQNAALAQSVHRKDLVQSWTLLSKIMSPKLLPEPILSKSFIPPWACHPFGKKLIRSLFRYYEDVKDIQMLALMSCMLAKQDLPDDIKVSYETPTAPENKSLRKLTNTSDGFQVSPEFPYNVFNKISASSDEGWSPLFVEEKQNDPEEELRKQHAINCRLLDADDGFRYDQFKRFYSEILYRWNFTTQRTEVAKYITEQPERSIGLDISLSCNTCKISQREPYCHSCKTILVKCSVCRIGVRGLLSFCMVCGHGGHMLHLIEWFGKYDWCAAGCDCYCLRIGKFSQEG